jgi:hypothetical protein
MPVVSNEVCSSSSAKSSAAQEMLLELKASSGADIDACARMHYAIPQLQYPIIPMVHASRVPLRRARCSPAHLLVPQQAGDDVHLHVQNVAAVVVVVVVVVVVFVFVFVVVVVVVVVVAIELK